MSLSFLRIRWKERATDITSFSSSVKAAAYVAVPRLVCPEPFRGRGYLYVASCDSTQKGSSTGEDRKGTVPGAGSCAVVAKAWVPHHSHLCDPASESHQERCGQTLLSPLPPLRVSQKEN